MERETITISAKNRPLGRLATEVALLLRGKNKPDFVLNKPGDCVVVIENIKEVKITGRK
ncbi:MAG: uL13 family ribosomal protein [bacterium]|nr:uL13 family ribosomal protein [bacterium]